MAYQYPYHLEEQRRRERESSGKGMGKEVAATVKKMSAMAIAGMRMAGFGALSIAGALGAAEVLPQPAILVGAAASLLALRGKKGEKTTKRKLLFATLALAAQPPAIGGLALFLPTPINPIVYLMRKAKERKTSDLAILTAQAEQDKGKAMVAQIAGLPRTARKGLAEKTMAPEKERGRKRDTPPPMPGIS